MNNIKISDHKAFVEKFLGEYLEDGMGVMSKREIDILVMHLLTKYSDLALVSNHDLSILLRTTESRIKGWRYEAKLKYPPVDEKYVETQFLYILARSQFDVEKGKIIFIIEDSYLRYAIQGRLKAKGMFADTSFNSEIVKIDYSSLESIIREMYGDETANKYHKDFENLLKKEKEEDQKITFKELKKEFINSAVKTLGSAATTALITYLQSLVLHSPV